MKLTYCYVVLQMLFLVFSSKLVKHEFKCYQKSIFVIFAFNTVNSSRNDKAVPSIHEKHKISYNVSTCVSTPINDYCLNNKTFWKTAPCYQRYRDGQDRIQCFLNSVYEIGENPLHSSRMTREKKKPLQRWFLNTPFLICYPNAKYRPQTPGGWVSVSFRCSDK